MVSALLELCFSEPFDFSSADRVARARDADPVTPAPAAKDRALFDRLRAGDPAALDEIMLARFNDLTRFAVGIVHDAADAEDIVQDVFLRLWTQRGAQQIERLDAYLYRSVRNEALNAVTGESRRARLREPLGAEASARQDAWVMSPDEDPRIAALRAAMATLKERRQLALRLRYDQELEYPDIAAILGISVNAAQQLLFHSIRALRRALGETVE